MKKAIVCGAGGFIGGHMVDRLLDDGYRVIAVDIKPISDWFQDFDNSIQRTSESTTITWCESHDLFDLRDAEKVDRLIRTENPDEIYQFAADMGGAGYVFTGEHDADIMHNSATINLNIASSVSKWSKNTKVFYSSSACIYPAYNQTDPNNPNCEEGSAYPADPDSEYGWEKLFSERMWRAYARNYRIDVRIARFHNIFGPHGSWQDGKEKAPAAMCRKAIEAGYYAPSTQTSTASMQVWGDGQQTRSFLYIDECIEAVRRLMESSVETVINIGSDEMIKINDLAKMAIEISGKDTIIENIEGPEGVRGRNSDNKLIQELLGWSPFKPLREGMEKTFNWIKEQVDASYNNA